MTTYQIIQCFQVIGLTVGLVLIARSIAALAFVIKERPVVSPNGGMPMKPLTDEQIAKQSAALVAALRAKAEQKQKQKDERGGMPAPDLMREGRYVSPYVGE